METRLSLTCVENDVEISDYGDNILGFVTLIYIYIYTVVPVVEAEIRLLLVAFEMWWCDAW
jgi:hypothetical protein